MTDYFLAKDVYFCCRSDAIVFLDLRNDEYSMINGREASTFREFFWGAREPSPARVGMAPRSIQSAESLPDVLHELVTGGLLTTDEAEGKPVVPTDTELPKHLLIDPDVDEAVLIDARCIWGFLVSCSIAAIRLRLQRIEITVREVERRKALKGADPLDWNKVRCLVAAFNKLRSFFPANYRCLFDSLALIEFLARYDIFPTWVFAVRPDRWGAHCWVQEDEIVFNEEVEETEDYMPIMVI